LNEDRPQVLTKNRDAKIILRVQSFDCHSYREVPLSRNSNHDEIEPRKYRRSGSSELFYAAMAVGTLCLAACQNTIQPDTVSKFSEGVAQTQTQAQAAFHDSNALARDESIEYVIATTRPGITEKDFAPALDPAAVAAWDAAFTAIESYASALEQLLSKDQTTQFTAAAVALGAELRTGQIGAEVSPGVATAFTQLGEVLLTMEAQKDARTAMRKADPAIRDILTAMAGALGASNLQGLRGTVWLNWQDKLDKGPVEAYAEAVKNHNNLDQKRTAANAYVQMLSQRDAQLTSLTNLRQSLLLLADAHSAAANGSPLNVAGLIALISQQTDETKSLLDQFSGKTAPTSQPAPLSPTASTATKASKNGD
jgi:hypothetical protein